MIGCCWSKYVTLTRRGKEIVFDGCVTDSNGDLLDLFVEYVLSHARMSFLVCNWYADSNWEKKQTNGKL